MCECVCVYVAVLCSNVSTCVCLCVSWCVCVIFITYQQVDMGVVMKKEFINKDLDCANFDLILAAPKDGDHDKGIHWSLYSIQFLRKNEDLMTGIAKCVVYFRMMGILIQFHVPSNR